MSEGNGKWLAAYRGAIVLTLGATASLIGVMYSEKNAKLDDIGKDVKAAVSTIGDVKLDVKEIKGEMNVRKQVDDDHSRRIRDLERPRFRGLDPN